MRGTLATILVLLFHRGTAQQRYEVRGAVTDICNASLTGLRCG